MSAARFDGDRAEDLSPRVQVWKCLAQFNCKRKR